MRREGKGRAVPTALLLAGALLLLYPTASDGLNRMGQKEAISGYCEETERIEEAGREELMEEALEYNRRLGRLGAPLADYDRLSEEYGRTLDVTGDGILGYVTIPGIDVELPIYHGTSEEVLKRAAGHLEGTSLPVGGEGSHAVISAHRGLPGARLFTRLDRVREGDTFTVTVLDRRLTYRVDRIDVVLPDELDRLNAVEGKDYVTLMTCTPYGINSHRLLVRGVRSDPPADGPTPPAEPEGLPAWTRIPAFGIPALCVTLAGVLFASRKRRTGTGKKKKADRKDP